MKTGMLITAVMAAACLPAQEPAPPAPPAAPTGPRHATRLLAGGGSYLGIGVAEIDAERARALQLKEERGVEIRSVANDSPAAKAGLKEGDVVLEYNGQPVEGIEQFQRLVRETPAGRQVRLLLSRGGSTQTVAVTVGKRPGHQMVMDDGQTFSFEMPEMPKMPVMPKMPEMPVIPRDLFAWASPRLGVETESLTSQLAQYFGVKEGALVRSVVHGSPAEKAGIKAGDVITKVNGTAVTSSGEITSVLRGLRGAKRTFPVLVVRDRKEMTVNVTLEESGGGDIGRRVRALISELDEF